MNLFFRYVACLLIILCICQAAKSQHLLNQVRAMQSPPLVYSALKIFEPILIDGKEDPVWQRAPWSSEFIDIEGSHQQTPSYSTRFKMLWDDNNLYILAVLQEPHIWATLKQRDAIIYHDNDFEVFIKPKHSAPWYYEIEVNALNTIMDLMMPKPYRFGGQALLQWDVKNLQSAVHIEGSLNSPKDIDQQWTVEMAIPFASLAHFAGPQRPSPNDYWRINFSRVQWQHDIFHGSYFKKKIDNKPLPENNWVWSPIGVINMHLPERWGFLHFSCDQEPAQLPPYYRIEKMAWNIHYLQNIHKHKHQSFTSDIKLLEGYDDFLAEDTAKYDIQLTVSENGQFYHLRLEDKMLNYIFTIDNYGNYTTNYE